MPATLTADAARKAVVPWTDVETAILNSPETFTNSRPELLLQHTLPVGGQRPITPNVIMQWSIPSAHVDQLLRLSIPDLPAVGEYQVELLHDQVNALAVTWTVSSERIDNPLDVPQV